MFGTQEPPVIPFHESLLTGISIEIETVAENIAPVGRGCDELENWFWQITIANTDNPFCDRKGLWGLYVVRSLRMINLTFNTSDYSTIIQLWPGDIPKKFSVQEDFIAKSMEICLVSYIARPKVGIIRQSRGLYRYHST